MNRSVAEIADLSVGFVMVTSTLPVPPGRSTISDALRTTVELVAKAVPESTAVTPVKRIEVVVTNVPQPSGPLYRLKAETIGAARYVNTSPDQGADMPPGVLTFRLTAPTA